MAHAAYEVRDSRTAKTVATFGNSTAAYDYADRCDAEFGAVRYTVVRNYDVMSDDEYDAFMVRVRAEKVAA